MNRNVATRQGVLTHFITTQWGSDGPQTKTLYYCDALFMRLPVLLCSTTLDVAGIFYEAKVAQEAFPKSYPTESH